MCQEVVQYGSQSLFTITCYQQIFQVSITYITKCIFDILRP